MQLTIIAMARLAMIVMMCKCLISNNLLSGLNIIKLVSVCHALDKPVWSYKARDIMMQCCIKSCDSFPWRIDVHELMKTIELSQVHQLFIKAKFETSFFP